jgi:hypothetical protein
MIEHAELLLRGHVGYEASDADGTSVINQASRGGLFGFAAARPVRLRIVGVGIRFGRAADCESGIGIRSTLRICRPDAGATARVRGQCACR